MVWVFEGCLNETSLCFFLRDFFVTLVFRHPKSGNMINQKHETLDKVDLLERMVDGIGR